jgi:phage tail tape-measure protein
MRFELSKLQREKKFLEAEIISFDKVIVELQKEMEQYSYILKQEQKNKIKKDEKNDELVASEYMQSKWIGKR